MTFPIKPVDTVRKPADMKPADLDGVEGRWLDVPRLQQKNDAEVQSNFWCGRTSAAMVANYYAKFGGKTDQYIGHAEGKTGHGSNLVKANLRWLGGPNKDKAAGVNEGGLCWPAGIFYDLGYKVDSGELVKNLQGIKISDNAYIEKTFSRHIAQLKKNNPVVQYTQLTEHKGHIVVICGYKKTVTGALWLRIVDPCYPHFKLIGTGNFQSITSPEEPDKAFSEYWIKAARLLDIYPGRTTRMFSHAEQPLGYFEYCMPDKPVPDDHELVHKFTPTTAGTGGGGGESGGGSGGASGGGSSGGSSGGSGSASSGGSSGGGAAGGTSGGAAGGGAAGGTSGGAAGGAVAAAMPPTTGMTQLPFPVDGSNAVTAEGITSIYHLAERTAGGFFPLGDTGLFHSGAHLALPEATVLSAMADGELVAARIGEGPGEHPWGDTGFVITRHLLKGDKKIYSLFMHLQREALHPDRASPWLKTLLLDASKDKEQKVKWRVLEGLPTWKDADKGKFSPANVQNDKVAPAGVYDEDEELVVDHKRYVKLKGQGWVRTSGVEGDEGKAKELSPYANFDLEKAKKNSPLVKALADGKVAVFDSEKDGDKHKYKLLAGEILGRSGRYIDGPTLHWSVFSKDEVFPGGALPEAEFGEKDTVKLASLDVSSKDPGKPEHSKALIEALDPKKDFLGKKADESILEPGELKQFYRTPTHCWRARYQAVKATSDFKLDVDKLIGQDRYKSHTEDEKKKFKAGAKDLIFWDELSSAEEFPTDGKAVWVHPGTALRLMSAVVLKADHDDPKEPVGGDPDRLHPGEDVVLVVRDSSGPLAAVDVTVRADKKVVKQGKTDSQGLIVVKLEDVQGKDVEIQLDEATVPKDSSLYAVANETGAPGTLMPGAVGGAQTTNGSDLAPSPRLGLQMVATKAITAFEKWDANAHLPSGNLELIDLGARLSIDRFVFRRDDGKFEASQVTIGGKVWTFWSIEDGVEKVKPDPEAHHDAGKEPNVIGSWSAQVAHLTDHPVLAGRTQNLADGTELEVTFCAMLALGAPEHDMVVEVARCKVAAGGFSVGFSPGGMQADNHLLNTPKPVYAKIKAAGKPQEFSLRDQAIVCYGEERIPDPSPNPAPDNGGGGAAGSDGKEICAYTSIDRGGVIDRHTLWDKSAAEVRQIKQLSAELQRVIVADGDDQLYVGPTALEQHLATEAEKHMSPADAITHQKQRTRLLFPDAPDSLFASPEKAWFSGNGLSTGICGIDCRRSIDPRGLANGCSMEIRNKNLSSCHTASYGPCQTGITLTGGLPVVNTCGAVLGACGSAHHDKSHCFMAEPVTGPNNEDRERWYVALPMHTKGDGYAYKHADRAVNLKVLLINPKNGAMVVCSQEDRGPGAKSSGHAAVPEASVIANEFILKGRMVGPSAETAWKLGLKGSGDPVVLMAFVSHTVPLGPVAPGTVIKLRKQVKFSTLMGMPRPGAAPGEDEPEPEKPSQPSGKQAAPKEPKGNEPKPPGKQPEPKQPGPEQPEPPKDPPKGKDGLKDSALAAFPSATAKMEGRLTWMYADNRGLVTTGMGNLIDPIVHAHGLPWKRGGAAVGQDEISAAWQAVKDFPNPNKVHGGHSDFKNLTDLRLDEADVDALCAKKVQEFWATLQKGFPKSGTWPADAQLALMFMAWGLGPAFGHGYPGFSKFVNAEPPDFKGSIEQATWKNINADRKKNIATLLENAQGVVDGGGDPDTLVWAGSGSSPTPQAAAAKQPVKKDEPPKEQPAPEEAKADAPKSDEPKPEASKKAEPKPEDPDAEKSREEYPSSPADLMERYLHMKFKVQDEEVEFTLDSLRYHNNGMKKDNEDNAPGHPSYIGDREKLKECIRQAKNKIDTADYAELVGEFVKEEKLFIGSAFYGKGSPKQIEAVLKCVGYLKKAGKLEHTLADSGMSRFWNDKGSLTESLKDFYFTNMGLDCSGFAGNYARWIAGPEQCKEYPEEVSSRKKNLNDLNPDMEIPEFARRNKSKKRTKVNQIMMGDLMVWFNKPNHIATILSHDGDKVTTVESNGDDHGCKGLGTRTFTVKPSGGGAWTTPSGTEVYIVSFT